MKPWPSKASKTSRQTGARRLARRALVLAVLVTLIVTLLTLSAPPTPLPAESAWQEVAISGDKATIEASRGTWFFTDLALKAVRIEVGGSPRLSLRMVVGDRLESAWVEGDEIRYRFFNAAGVQYVHALIPCGGSLAMVKAGREPSWCGSCPPHLRRFGSFWFLETKFRWASYGWLDKFNRASNRLIRAL